MAKQGDWADYALFGTYLVSWGLGVAVCVYALVHAKSTPIKAAWAALVLVQVGAPLYVASVASRRKKRGEP